MSADTQDVPTPRRMRSNESPRQRLLLRWLLGGAAVGLTLGAAAALIRILFIAGAEPAETWPFWAIIFLAGEGALAGAVIGPMLGAALRFKRLRARKSKSSERVAPG